MPHKILIITGTRPNFVKVTQFKKAAADYPNVEIEIVHTGQHYDKNMSEVFFTQFGLKPDYFLNIPAGTPVSQLSEIMKRLEELVNKIQPRLMMVVGDVNSTLAGALVANKLGIELAHLESGLRSLDRSMPEEINRILTDEITDYFFVTEQSGIDNLITEGKHPKAIHFVGNTMIDTLVGFQQEIEASPILEKMEIEPNSFVLMTIHRPATVDVQNKLEELIGLMEWVSASVKIVFPIHPRTINSLRRFGLYERFESIPGLTLTEPMDYFAFQKLVANCRFILTDSGGIQEESTFLKKPCLTLRPNTERPSTIEVGSNELIGEDWSVVRPLVKDILNDQYKKGNVPPMWDGRATWRVLDVLSKNF